MRTRIVSEFPGLVISDCGTLWGPSGKRLRTFVPKRGPYPRFNLYQGGGKWKQYGVHTVVCIAFHGPRPEGMMVRHLDGNPLNNKASNLCWGTQQENEADKKRHGTATIGERHPSAVLTEQQVIKIRSHSQRRGIGAELAREYGISETAVSYIRNGKTWRHLG